jgi:hypothetical protein
MACLESLFMHIHILEHVEFFALHIFVFVFCCYLLNFCFAYALH